ncbi:MAG TPA: branched-chain amino acid ABC transporter ATP-binding protein/permease [Stellaceae bacterium]
MSTSPRAVGRQPRALLFAAFIVAILLYPIVMRSDYALGAAITVGAMAIASVGFVLLIGYAHQLAIGQAAFCTIGGYGSALLVTRHGWDPFPAMLVAMVGAMALAYVVGRPILKLRGFVLAMASLALQLILGFLAVQWTDLTGGAIGIDGVPRFAIFGWAVGGDRDLFYVVWGAVALAVLVGLNIDRSRIGRELKAIASSERAAGSVGIDLAAAKVRMFVLSAGMASVAGSLTVHYLRLMDPGVFGFQYSLDIITAVVIGGLTSIWGGVLGAAIIVALREGLRFAAQPLFEGIVMGALTVLVLLLFPRGVAGGIADLYRRIGSRSEMSGGGGAVADFSDTASVVADDGTILTLDGVSRRFGSLVAVDQVGFTVQRHSITALIGPNGAGKTTLFNMISGDQPLDGGRIVLAGERIDLLPPHRVARRGVARTFQNLELFDNLTVLDNVMCGRARHAATGLIEIVARLPRVAREERVQRAAATRCLAFVGLADAAHRMPSALPFGHQRLLEIARALALEPALLLLDEPASGLNDSETEALADLILRIRARGVTVLLVEHDIRLVMGLADHIVVMNYGKKIAEGAPALVRADPHVLAAYLGS